MTNGESPNPLPIKRGSNILPIIVLKITYHTMIHTAITNPWSTRANATAGIDAHQSKKLARE